MRENDPDTILAYYCWVNRNWTPGQYDALSRREKLLIAEFAKKESSARERLMEKK